jgi:SpoVK/Ycf46/Vps4 family AAA+-type ATPase
MFNSLQNLFLEAFEKLRGVLIATTNMKENLDTAFSRRFHLKLDFPIPGDNERKALWHLHLPASIPGATEIDINYLSKLYKITGGQISIIVKNAATEAAARKGKSKILKLDDLMKYCEIEAASMFGSSNMKIGFEGRD